MKKSSKTIYRFPVVIEKDESGYYIGKVPSLKSCYTQAKTLAELYKRLKEVAALCMEVAFQFTEANIWVSALLKRF